ncbi:MAG TPA: (d)CMP kinase [Acidimicrobiales bacterium]
MTPKVIAIDGPAGSGKSTVARAIAARLGLDYLDTGAMYRSVTLAVLDRDVDPSDGDAIAAMVGELAIEVGERVTIDGADATSAIRGPEVSALVSVVAAHPEVRANLVARQRRWVEARGGGVVEGRDIGTVVFPDAEVKVYLTASEAERVRRREAEAGADVAREVVRRDEIDSSRRVSPLLAADDALVIDTTGRAIEEIVEEVLSKL